MGKPTSPLDHAQLTQLSSADRQANIAPDHPQPAQLSSAVVRPPSCATSRSAELGGGRANIPLKSRSARSAELSDGRADIPCRVWLVELRGLGWAEPTCRERADRGRSSRRCLVSAVSSATVTPELRSEPSRLRSEPWMRSAWLGSAPGDCSERRRLDHDAAKGEIAARPCNQRAWTTNQAAAC